MVKDLKLCYKISTHRNEQDWKGVIGTGIHKQNLNYG